MPGSTSGNGEQVVRKGKLVTMDEREVVMKANWHAKELMQKAGIRTRCRLS